MSHSLDARCRVETRSSSPNPGGSGKWGLRIAIALLGMLALPVPAAQAQYVWAGVNNNYSNPGTWELSFVPTNSIPGAGNTATLDDSRTTTAYTVTLNSSNAIGTLNLQAPFFPVRVPTLNHTGGVYTVGTAINLAAGTYNLNGGTITGGAFTQTGGTFNHLNGTYTLGGAMTLNGGAYNLNGGTIIGGSITGNAANLFLRNNNANRLQDVQVNSATLNFTTSGGRVTLAGTTNFTAATTLSLANANVVSIEGTAIPSNLTQVNLSGGSALNVAGGNTLTTAIPINATGNSGLGGTGAIINQGTITKTTAGTTLTINPSVGFRNEAILSVAVDGGTVTIASTGVTDGVTAGLINTIAGTLEVLDNGVMNINGAGWVNQGTLKVTNGTLNLGGSTTTAGLGLGGVQRSGGTINLTGQLDNTDTTLAPNTTTGDLRLFGGTITGGTLSTGGAQLVLGNHVNNRLDNVQIGPGVLNFSEAGGRVVLSGTTGFTVVDTALTLTNGNVLGIQQSAMPTNLTQVNLSGGSALNVVGGGTLTSTIEINATGDSQLGGTGTFVNQGTITKTTASTTLTINPSVGFTNQGTVAVAVDGGTISIPDSTNLTNYDTGTGILSGGTWEVNNNGTLDLGARSITTISNAQVTLNGANSTFGALNSLASIETATLSVQGGRNFTPTGGALSVTGSGESSQGVLDVRAGSHVTANVTLGNISLLKGSGTIAGHVTAGTNSVIAPDLIAQVLDSPLTVTGGLEFTGGSSSNFVIQLNSTTAGTGYSQMVVTGGTIDLGGANLYGTVNVTPQLGDNFFIIVNQTGQPINGTFLGLVEGSQVTIDSKSFYIGYHGDSVNNLPLGGNDVVLTLTPIPEPTHVLALAAGVLGVAGWVVRRRKLQMA